MALLAERGQNSVISIVTTGWTVWGLNSGRGKIYTPIQTSLKAPELPLLWVPGLFPRDKVAGV